MSQSPRIALVTGGLCLGGSSTFLLNLAGELVRRSVSVLVASLEKENPYADDFRRLRIPLHIEDDRARILEDRLGGVLDRLREFQPTVVVACLGTSSFEILRYVPDGVLRLGMIQSDFPENYPPFAPYTPYLDGMIGVSRKIEATLRAHPQLGRVPAHYLPYGVEVPEVPAGRVLPPVERGIPISILYLGRLCQPQKRVRFFPEIASQLRDAGVPYRWTIAGDGPERAWLEKELASRPGAEVLFPGPLTYEQVPAVLDAHDVFLLASDAEGLPLSLLEAMGRGLVPVVSDLQSGISEVVDASTGILVDPANVAGYAAGIAALARDRERYAALSAQAVQRILGSFSVAAMTDRWLAVIGAARQSGQPTRWDEHPKLHAPIGHAELRYTLPIRLLRRLVRRLDW